MEYTGGEWEIVGNSVYSRLPLQKPEIVCYVQGKNRKANARLISACPDLYEACKLAVRYIETTDPGFTDEITRKVNKAIAKAEQTNPT